MKSILNRQRSLPLLAVCTACWYWTSSISAVASQQMVEACHGADACASPLILMALLTVLQLMVGLIVCSPLLLWFGSLRSLWDILKNSPTNQKDLVLGGLHFTGCLLTNTGYAYGSAGLVQSIKMLEPIETLILTAVVNVLYLGKPSGITLRTVAAVALIVGGISALLSQKAAFDVDPAAILAASASGVVMSSRNVVKKVFFAPAPAQRATATTEGRSWNEKCAAGMQNFARITLASSCFAAVATIPTVAIASGEATANILQSAVWTTAGIQAVLFHGLYNISSIIVLTLVSAQTHSLLNAGKRISNVLVAALVFSVPLGLSGMVGLAAAGVGALLYAHADITLLVTAVCIGAIALQVRFALDSDAWDPMQVFLLTKDNLSSSWNADMEWIFAQDMVSNSSTSTSVASSALANRMFFKSALQDSKSPSRMVFDLQNPAWPAVPPRVNPHCRVKFRDPNLAVCHILPWANFGDELGPFVTKRILELYFGCSTDDLPVFDMRVLPYQRWWNRTTTCLMTVGSLWRMMADGDHIWGTGMADGVATVRERCKTAKAGRVNNVIVYSSRGPQSAHLIRRFCNFTTNSSDGQIEGAGDGGVLVPFLFPEYNVQVPDEDKRELCGVPHLKDQGSNLWKNIPRDNLFYVSTPWQNMTMKLQSCRQVVSSSLHGIILAETLGIPSRRVRVTKKPGDFKFHDFYESFRGIQPEVVGELQAALDNMTEPLRYEERDAYARRVLKTFPIHLFETEAVPSEQSLTE